MIKKILLSVFIIGAITVGLLGYGTYKFADEMIKEKEPQLRQYIALNAEQQNEYILEHADEVFNMIEQKATSATEIADIEMARAAKTNPVVQENMIQVGRSIMAKGIIYSDAIVKNMSMEVKAGYEIESNNFENNLDAYSKALDEYSANQSK